MFQELGENQASHAAFLKKAVKLLKCTTAWTGGGALPHGGGEAKLPGFLKWECGTLWARSTRWEHEVVVVGFVAHMAGSVYPKWIVIEG